MQTNGKLYNNIVETVGGTPLVKLNSVTRGIEATIAIKCEYFNPLGSVKDRIGMSMIEAAEADGKLEPGGTVIEATAGNTGLGLALVKHILNRHHGRMSIESMPGAGATFTVYLPLATTVTTEKTA